MRYIMLKSRYNGDVTVDSLTSSTIDLSRLPPTKAWLREHTVRANYQTKIWKTANIPISEVPADQLMYKLKNMTILMMMTMTPT